jgi:vacuolar-type H+-ATPase subunit H
MKELINNELLQLQNELESLKSASEMISEAGKASDAVIEEAKTIHKEFAGNLDKLTSLYQKYIDQISTETSQKVGSVASTAENSVKNLVSEQSALLKSNAEESLKKIELVKSTYLNQTAKTDQLLNSYLELAQSTTELKNKISAVDFPARLEKLNALLSEAIQGQKFNNTELEKINKVITDNQAFKQSQKNSTAISSLKGLLWTVIVLLIGLIGFSVFLYLKFK